MGSSSGIACKKCDYTKNFRMGIGMMYFEPNLTAVEGDSALLPHLIKSKKTQSYIRELFDTKNVTIPHTYGHDIYNCESCHEFYNRFFIHLDYEGGSFEPEYKCPKCNKILKLIDYTILEEEEYWPQKEVNLEKYPCPKCGEHSLYEHGGEHILWD